MVSFDDLKFPDFNRLDNVAVVSSPRSSNREDHELENLDEQIFSGILLIHQPGKVTLPPARFYLNDYWYETNPVEITLQPELPPASSDQPGNSNK